MTRRHAMAQLLRHGPMPLRDICLVTGWPYRACQRSLEHLVGIGKVRAIDAAGQRKYVAAEPLKGA